MSLRIAVLGVGAIGGTIGGYLARAGQDVTLIDMWPANVEGIKERGIKITAPDTEFIAQAPALHLAEVSSDNRRFDAVFLCVKSYDTEWSAKFIEPYLAPGGYVVSAQNSINEDSIASVVGWTRIVGCVVTLGAAMYEPGHVQRTSSSDRPSTKLGEPSGLVSRRVAEMRDILSAVGPCLTTTNLWGERWAKLGVNCMSNAIAGSTGLTSAQIREIPEVRDLSIRITAELVNVAEALGVNVEPMAGIEAPMFAEALVDGGVREEVESRLMEFGKGIGTGRPSLAQDVFKGRRTEVDELNGLVVRKGKEVGVLTPVNQAVIGVTKRVESGELEPSMSNVQLIDSTI